MRVGRLFVIATIALCGAIASHAADLTIGLATDVTSLDPHYHNLTPNNNIAQHVYGFLVQRNEKEQLEPGLATQWKTVDPTTWEFTLRKGVKFHDGSDFTAADVVASINRVPKVPNSPSPFTAYTKQITRDRGRRSLHGPLAHGDAVSADAFRHDADRDHFEGRGVGVHRRLQFGQGGDRHGAVQARALRQG